MADRPYESDPWDWQVDALKLDGCPLEMTRCFWDDIPTTEEDSNALFSTPLADIIPQDPPLYPVRDQDPEASSTPGLCDNVFRGAFQGGSPRIKRRRLDFREPESSFDSREESNSDLEFLTGCGPDIQGSMESNILPTDPFWYRPCDDPTNAFGDVMEGVSSPWMTKCLEEGEAIKMRDDMKIALPGNDSCNVGLQQSSRDDDVQGPATPLPGRTSIHGSSPTELRKQLSPPSTPNPGKLAAAAPVAYPFTLLKPEGGLTLKEINEKLMLPPSRPVPHVQAEDGWPTFPGELGLGLSGKSVIARTRIHTMGNGTITIMRTRD